MQALEFLQSSDKSKQARYQPADNDYEAVHGHAQSRDFTVEAREVRFRLYDLESICCILQNYNIGM